MNIIRSFKNLNKFELSLWITSLVVITVSSLLSGTASMLSIITSLLGATALIFVAKGDVLGQVILIGFCLLYGVISIQNRYYGEMITYVGMSMPIAVVSLVTWLRHPFKGAQKQVEVNKVTRKQIIIVALLTVSVTTVFYFVLRALDTANLIVSTVSVATSFAAASLTALRSPAYALGYSTNDIVLIILWVSASIKDPSNIPMVACFVIFLANDLYGFFNWMRMKKTQEDYNKNN